MLTGSSHIDAQRAFAHASRARRRAAVIRRLRRRRCDCSRLALYDPGAIRRGRTPRGIHPIPLAEISGTVEPSRAAQFDSQFLPGGVTRARWQRIWLAEHRGAVLPPISVVPVDGGYAVRDGHHRVSVAKARGALSIDAIVDTL